MVAVWTGAIGSLSFLETEWDGYGRQGKGRGDSKVPEGAQYERSSRRGGTIRGGCGSRVGRDLMQGQADKQSGD